MTASSPQSDDPVKSSPPTPAATATPTKPRRSPAICARLRRSPNRTAVNTAANSGVEALSTAASAEEMCCSPHAKRVNGTAL